jgi:hypothetical protein
MSGTQLAPCFVRVRIDKRRAQEERYMRNAKITSFGFCSVMLLLGASVGCTPGSNGANDVADEVGKALDPTPDYVDPPAAEPQKPQ